MDHDAQLVAPRGVLAAWIVFVPPMFRFEERLLLAKFGDNYARYVLEFRLFCPPHGVMAYP